MGSPCKQEGITKEKNSKRIELWTVLFCFWPPARRVLLRKSSSVAQRRYDSKEELEREREREKSQIFLNFFFFFFLPFVFADCDDGYTYSNYSQCHPTCSRPFPLPSCSLHLDPKCVCAGNTYFDQETQSCVTQENCYHCVYDNVTYNVSSSESGDRRGDSSFLLPVFQLKTNRFSSCWIKSETLLHNILLFFNYYSTARETVCLIAQHLAGTTSCDNLALNQTTDRPTTTSCHAWKEEETGRQTDRQAGGRAGRQADRQTDRDFS